MEIKVKQGQKESTINCHQGESLYKALCDHNIFVDAVCAGNGTCGKCKIVSIDNDLPLTAHDKVLLSKEEINHGVRLACQAYPTKNCDIIVNEKPEYQTPSDTDATINNGSQYGIAIDIGTTTIVYRMVNPVTGEPIRKLSEVNHNRMYGADIMRRIDAANRGYLKQMRNQLTDQIRNALKILTTDTEGMPPNGIVIAANMTMVHILMGYSCEGMAGYPFTPVSTDFIVTDTEKLKILSRKIPVTILPSISAFIGGDIVSGIYRTQIVQSHKNSLFLDLGTNGEFVLVNRDGQIFVTSTSAGPAFEGGGISCVTGTIAGAIQSITIKNNCVELETIQNIKPVGFCGTGIVELLYELRKNKIIDETGLLQERYFDTGFPVYSHDSNYITVTQNDIRQIQMAKAAIAAGISVLLNSVGMENEQIEDVYIAGGFGYYRSLYKMIGIGLLRKEWEAKTHIIGNASVLGAAAYLCRQNNQEIEQIRQTAKEIYLSNIPEFTDLYLQNMFLPDIAEND